MAVYTDISETEISAFLQLYDIGSLRSYKGIAEGVENSNFLLQTDKGAFILTLYEKRVDKNDLPFFLNLMNYLNEQGISCPLPVKQLSGDTIGTLAERPCAIVTFLNGMWMRRPSADHAREVGKALAQLHKASHGFNMQRVNTLSAHNWRDLWNKCALKADQVEPGLRHEVESDLAYVVQNWPNDLPNGVCHGDLFPDNVFFLQEKISGLIDFYFACHDFYVYDLAICLNAWCFEKDHAFNITKGAALLQGYQSVRSLSELEIEALPLMARGSALRFMLTRLYDWLNTPNGALVVKKDPLEYVRKMRFHRTVNHAREYGLIGS
jgi:homoserine kinase type II